MSTSLSLLDRLTAFAEEKQLSLPVLSNVAVRVQRLAASEDYDIAEIERLILSDQALAAEVLRAANSPFFGGLSKANTVRNAVVRLGLGEVTRLLFSATERSKYTAKDPRFRELLGILWKHAAGCALASYWLAHKLGYTELEEEAFLGGLLHDVGKLFLIRALDEMKSAGRLEIDPPPALIQELIDSVHPAQGERLLQSWHVPEKYVVVARDHHATNYSKHDSLLLIVRVANLACRKLGIGMNHDASIVLVASDEAGLLGCDDVLLAELEIKLEDQLQPAS